MISQANISANTPMGANLIGGGATFRAWAPRATAVYVNGTFGGTPMTGQTDDLLMAKDANGYWTGFIPNAAGRRPLPFLGRGAGTERLQARSLCARNGLGRSVPDLQLPDSLRHSISLARLGIRHARLHQHDHLSAAHWNVRSQCAWRRLHVSRCDREDSLSCRAWASMCCSRCPSMKWRPIHPWATTAQTTFLRTFPTSSPTRWL